MPDNPLTDGMVDALAAADRNELFQSPDGRYHTSWGNVTTSARALRRRNLIDKTTGTAYLPYIARTGECHIFTTNDAGKAVLRGMGL